MSDVTAQVIATLVASYKSEMNTAPAMPQSRPSKLAQVKAARAAAEAASPSNHTVEAPKVSTTLSLPPAGSLNAHGFVKAMRQAGLRRDDAGKLHTDPSKVRDDKIRAIAAFVGYDVTGAFGAQELQAMAKARHQIQGAPKTTNPFSRCSPIVQGFIAGMPDEQAKCLADLQGRERLATETMLEQTKLAQQATDLPTRQYHQALAIVEQERLIQIQKDLAALLG